MEAQSAGAGVNCRTSTGGETFRPPEAGRRAAREEKMHRGRTKKNLTPTSRLIIIVGSSGWDRMLTSHDGMPSGTWHGRQQGPGEGACGGRVRWRCGSEKALSSYRETWVGRRKQLLAPDRPAAGTGPGYKKVDKRSLRHRSTREELRARPRTEVASPAGSTEVYKCTCTSSATEGA